MKISCPCGNDISDSTDFISYKAALIADQDGDDLRQALAQGADPWAALRQHTAATVYQCTECGRLVVMRGNELHWFSPETTVRRLLYSKRGAQWPRSLVGHWRDGRGELSWDCSMAPDDEDDEFRTDFGSWQELYDLYDSTFRRFLASGRLRSALLKRDGELVHLWPPVG